MGESEWCALLTQGRRNERARRRKHAKLWDALELHGRWAHGNWNSRRQRHILQLAAIFDLRPVAGGGQWLEYEVSGEKRPGHTRESVQLAAVREPQPLQRADGIRTVHSARRVARLLERATQLLGRGQCGPLGWFLLWRRFAPPAPTESAHHAPARSQ
jgi:hypothetical protein